MVGERGVTLSGGQKQRVAIARTLTGRTPIVVFDDSLSAVDTETDEAIRENLKKQVSGVTQILVSHRILTLLDCDQVLVLEHGAVRQLGTPAGAFAGRRDLFREIYRDADGNRRGGAGMKRKEKTRLPFGIPKLSPYLKRYRQACACWYDCAGLHRQRAWTRSSPCSSSMPSTILLRTGRIAGLGAFAGALYSGHDCPDGDELRLRACRLQGGNVYRARPQARFASTICRRCRFPISIRTASAIFTRA